MKLLHAILAEDAAKEVNLRSKRLKKLDLSEYGAIRSLKLDINQLTTLEGGGIPEVLPGAFSCDKNNLKTLKGCPKKVGAYFSVSKNPNLASLEGGPAEVGTGYYCIETAIENLKGVGSVGQSLYANGCKLKSLEGLSCKRLDEFDVSANFLTDLKNGPTHDVDLYDASYNELTSLEGAPLRANSFDVSYNNRLTSLEGIGQRFLKGCETLNLKGCPIKSHALGLVLIRANDVTELNGDFPGIEILDKYISQGHDALIDCQHALIAAGFEDLAQL